MHVSRASFLSPSLLCGLCAALLKTRFIQRINSLTFGRFEGKKFSLHNAGTAAAAAAA